MYGIYVLYGERASRHVEIFIEILFVVHVHGEMKLNCLFYVNTIQTYICNTVCALYIRRSIGVKQTVVIYKQMKPNITDCLK